MTDNRRTSHEEKAMQALVQAGEEMLEQRDPDKCLEVLVESAAGSTGSDLAAFYILDKKEKRSKNLKLEYRKFRRNLPESISMNSELVSFILDCREAVVLLSLESEPGECCFREVILHPDMKSGIALPVSAGKTLAGVLLVNSKKTDYYNRRRFRVLESLVKLAGSILETTEQKTGEEAVV